MLAIFIVSSLLEKEIEKEGINERQIKKTSVVNKKLENKSKNEEAGKELDSNRMNKNSQEERVEEVEEVEIIYEAPIDSPILIQ